MPGWGLQHGGTTDVAFAFCLLCFVCRGDLPYSVDQAVTGTWNIIADMNNHDLAFTIYDGDW